MQVEIKIPSVGESVQEAILAEWYKKDGDAVKKDDPLLVIETDKVTLEVVAEADGVLSIAVAEGETVAVGAVVGHIETEGAAAEEKPPEKEAEKEKEPEKAEAAPEREKEPEKEPEPAPAPAPEKKPEKAPGAEDQILSPAVRKLAKELNIDMAKVTATGPGGRVTKGDILLYRESQAPAPAGEKPDAKADAAATPAEAAEGGVRRKRMSAIRKRIAERLLEARQNTAMLTTFNEIDMSRAMEIRSLYKEDFKKRHGINLGFMSFFIKASVEALKEFPAINAFIEGGDIVYHDYYNIGVAVGSERGLVVPVIRNAESLGFAELEQAIVDFVGKIKENKLALFDMEGGTFTITNGGVFGSLLSTPILNTPQSGILGMHKIEKRPIVVDDEIVIRPMMYVALSYDHRIVDGREAVTCLRRIKECVENPERIMMEV